MPGIVPELRHSRHRTRSAIASQFWESAEHSSRSIDGQVWELPCEPPALNLTGSSGLSRSQQLIAAQSLGAPAIPSFDSNSGGWVCCCASHGMMVMFLSLFSPAIVLFQQ